MKRELKLISTCLLSIGFLAAVGCVHNRTILNADQSHGQNIKGDENLSVDIEWIKNKPDGIDMMIVVENHYSHPVFIKDKSFMLAYEGVSFSPRKGGVYLELAAGERRQNLLIFKMDKASKPQVGTAVLTIDPIFEGTIEKVGKKLLPLKITFPVRT